LGDLLVFQVKRVLGVMVAGAIVASLAACGNRGSGDAATTTTPATSAPTAHPTTSTTLDPATEVEQAYLAFDAMYTRLREDPNPDDSEIAVRTTGHTKDALISSQTTAKTLGERAIFGPEGRVEVVRVDLVDGDTAIVRSCVVENLTITNPAGGKHGPEIGTYWTEYTLSRVTGSWKVSSSEAIRKQDGQQPCEA
jgi:hypothetical protein